MPGDVDPAANPNPVLAGNIIEKSHKRRRPPRPARKTAVQTDAHHPGLLDTLCVKYVESIFEIGEKLIAGIETRGRGKTHIVAIERIGYDEVRTVLARYQLRQIIGV